MKQKILEALKQGYKNLGMSEEAFERVAAFGETFITSEEQIATFVSGAGAILKAEQSAADKVRTKAAEEKKSLEAKIAELEAKLKENGETQPTETKKDESELSQLIKLMQEQNEQMRKQNEALTARFDAFEADRNAKTAFTTAEATFKGNDYVKKYADEATDAWERATEMYEATGKKWTAEELLEKANGYFNKAVSRKGVDTSKPLDSDGGGGDETPNFSAFDRVLEKQKENQ